MTETGSFVQQIHGLLIVGLSSHYELYQQCPLIDGFFTQCFRQ